MFFVRLSITCPKAINISHNQQSGKEPSDGDVVVEDFSNAGEELQETSRAAVRFEPTDDKECSSSSKDEIAVTTPKVTFNGELETLEFEKKSKIKSKSLTRNSQKFKLDKN